MGLRNRIWDREWKLGGASKACMGLRLISISGGKARLNADRASLNAARSMGEPGMCIFGGKAANRYRPSKAGLQVVEKSSASFQRVDTSIWIGWAM
jgi:hypothetical protein